MELVENKQVVVACDYRLGLAANGASEDGKVFQIAQFSGRFYCSGDNQAGNNPLFD